MNNNKLIKIIIVGIIVLVALSIAIVFLQGRNNGLKSELTNEESGENEIKEVEFVVVRVLPSGFSPKEVTIKRGMIVRFTNPLEDKVTLKWEGTTQYTNEAVYEGNDIATTVFDTEGTYTFTDDSNHSGKVTVR